MFINYFFYLLKSSNLFIINIYPLISIFNRYIFFLNKINNINTYFYKSLVSLSFEIKIKKNILNKKNSSKKVNKYYQIKNLLLKNDNYYYF